MRIVPPDFARRIELHGVGPCPRPVDIDRAHHDFATLVSLRVYAFSAGMVVDGEAEDDEVYVVLMSGTAEIAVTQGGVEAGRWALDTAGGARAVYLPPSSSYRLTAVEDCAIAYARAVPLQAVPAPAGFVPEAGRLASDHATRMTLTLVSAGAGGQGLPAVAGGQGVPAGGGERFVHVRGDGAATLAGAPLEDWGSALLDDGDDAAPVVTQGTVEVLTIGAKGR